MKREFKAPLSDPKFPLVPVLGVLVCLAMIYGLGWTNWLRLGVWLVLGLIIYFGYSKNNSRLNNPDK